MQNHQNQHPESKTSNDSTPPNTNIIIIIIIYIFMKSGNKHIIVLLPGWFNVLELIVAPITSDIAHTFKYARLEMLLYVVIRPCSETSQQTNVLNTNKECILALFDM